jgi:hypothetical protein
MRRRKRRIDLRLFEYSVIGRRNDEAICGNIEKKRTADCFVARTSRLPMTT